MGAVDAEVVPLTTAIVDDIDCVDDDVDEDDVDVKDDGVVCFFLLFFAVGDTSSVSHLWTLC